MWIHLISNESNIPLGLGFYLEASTLKKEFIYVAWSFA